MTDAQIDAAVGQVFAKYDTDKSGSLDKGELKKVITDVFAHMGQKKEITDDDISKVMTAMDSSKDGKISPAELKAIIKKALE
jgi:Ca2+-binding EF-hand superfamily protein